MTNYTNILPTAERDAQILLSDTDGGQGHTPYNRVLLEINENGRVDLFARTYYGGDGVPVGEWHRRDLVFTVQPNADGEQLRADLAEGERVAVLIDRIKAGHSINWDGSNMVGTLSADAEDASQELEELLHDYPTYSGQVASAEIWLTGGTLGLTECVAPGDTAKNLLAAAEGDGWLITDGIEGMQACIEEAARERAEREAE
jgi:hypothetical protein